MSTGDTIHIYRPHFQLCINKFTSNPSWSVCYREKGLMLLWQLDVSSGSFILGTRDFRENIKDPILLLSLLHFPLAPSNSPSCLQGSLQIVLARKVERMMLLLRSQDRNSPGGTHHLCLQILGPHNLKKAKTPSYSRGICRAHQRCRTLHPSSGSPLLETLLPITLLIN